MSSDLYTKAVLTVIAAALIFLSWQGMRPKVIAVERGCGQYEGSACYVRVLNR